MITKNYVEKSISGLAWYSNTMPVEQGENVSSLIINKLQVEGIDYLVIFCHGSKIRRSKRFILTDLERSTRMYKKTFLVTDSKLNIKVCVMNCEPCSSVLPDRAVNLKFDNEILYLKLFNPRYVNRFLQFMGLKFQYISRLDIYRDFQSFRSFLPDILIKNFAQEKFLCKSHAKFDIIGSHTKDGLDFQYFRNGKKSTGRQFYLYNKSNELREVGNKEHIVNTWLKAGFDQTREVWRLELSMCQLRRNVILHPLTGEMEQVKLRDVFNKQFIHRMYEAGLKTSFSFVLKDHTRKANGTPVKLFNAQVKNIRLIWGALQCDKLRMRKIIVKSLIVDILEDKEQREHKSSNFQDRINWINRYVDENSMNMVLLKIISRLAIQYKAKYYDSLSKFLYNYFAE